MYRHLTLLRLAELIVHNSDSKALDELHNERRVFYYHSKKPLLLVEFVDKLRQSKPAWRWCNGDEVILEKAYDLTISKFASLPKEEEKEHGRKLQGPDCRCYYEALLVHAAKRLDAKSCSRNEDADRQVAQLLQKLVVRHFQLSCRECCRKGKGLQTRYLWHIKGQAMEVLVPIDIKGQQRGKWLAENIRDVDPMRPGERRRVQVIIDDITRKRTILFLENIEKDKNQTVLPYLPVSTKKEMTIKRLADVIADEKSENIELQRDAIRRLGKKKLRRLIREIFDSLGRGNYEAVKIADTFGVNRTTFSRFAGTRWLTRAGMKQDCPTPDLWLNTAQTLAKHPVFVKVAEDAGVLERVEQVIKNSKTQVRNGACHE